MPIERHRAWPKATAVIAAAGFLAAAWWGSDGASAADKIKIGEPPTVLFRLPLYIAVQNGYLAEAGLDATVVNAGSARTANMLLASGGFDLVAGQFIDGVQLNKQGMHVLGVALLTDRAGNSIVVRKALAGPVKSMRDLKGRTIGMIGIGSGTWQFAVLAARLDGMTPEDFIFISTGGGANVIGAIKSGRVDALSYGDLENLQLVRDGDAAFLYDATDAATHKRFFGDTYLNNQLMVLDSYAKAHPRIVQAAVNAIQRALNWTNTHSPEAITRVLVGSPGYAEVDRDLLLAAVKRMRASVPATAVITHDAFDNAMKLAVELGALDRPMSFDQLVDNGFAEAAAKSNPPEARP